VYKYNLSGSLLGSWTIDAANSSPTGVTINPNNVSDIWIVDSGTKKVYTYTAAASRTSGSQNAASSFALAANNTNPQDIADPSVPGSEVVAAPAMVTPIAAAPIQSLSRPAQPSDWVRWLMPTMPAAAVASSNATAPPTQARTAAAAEAMRVGEPNGM